MQVKSYDLSPLDSEWTRRISEIRYWPTKKLLKQFKRFYKFKPAHFNRDAIVEKVAYYYQYLVLKYQGVKLSPRLLERTRRVVKNHIKNETVFEQENLDRREVNYMAKKKVAKKKGGPSIASMVYALIEKGLSDEKIIKAVKKKHPESKINKVHMAWYRRQLKIKNGEIVIDNLYLQNEVEPGIQVPDIFTLYEQNIGIVTPLIAEDLQEAQDIYPPEWIESAFKEAVRLNKRSWKYIVRILERWKFEGKADGKPGRDIKKTRDSDRYIKGKYGYMVKR